MSQTKAQLVSGTTAQDLTVNNINTTSVNSTQLSHRRININGGMEVAQRGTSAATQDGVEGYKTIDRWRLLYSSSAGGEATMSQDSDVPTDYSYGRFSNSLKMDVTTADTSVSGNHAITLQHRIEAQDIRNSGWDYTNPNSILSVSFWAKSSKAGTYCVALNSQDASPNLDIIKEYTLVANTWKHVEFEIPGNSSLVIDDNNGSGMNFLWALVVGTNRQIAADSWTSRTGEAKYGSSNQVNFYDSTDNNFFLTGVQIEVGKATIFEHRNFGEELALCQRYYFRYLEGNTKEIGSCWYFTNTHISFFFEFPTTMRVVPTGTATSGTDYYTNYRSGAADGINSISFENGSTEQFSAFNNTQASGTAGQCGLIRSTNASAIIEFSAEL